MYFTLPFVLMVMWTTECCINHGYLRGWLKPVISYLFMYFLGNSLPSDIARLLTTVEIFIAPLTNTFDEDVNLLCEIITLLVWAACGGVIQRGHGHIALESYPINARCEWTVQVERGSNIELRWGTYFKSAWNKHGN